MAGIHDGGSIEDQLPNTTLHEYLFDFMNQYRERTALVNFTSNTSYTFCEWKNTCQHFGYGLRSLGYGKGDVITIYGFNSEHLLFVVLGSLSAGLTVNTINPAATAFELKHYFKEVQPKLIFTEYDLVENVHSALAILSHKPKILLKEENRGYQSVLELSRRLVTVTQALTFDPKNDVAFILFSSGTTGLPKGVMLTHHNVVAELHIRESLSVFPCGWNTVVSVFPMYHVAGLFGSSMGSIITGTFLVFMEKYNLEALLRAIDKFKPNILTIPPSVIVQLAKTPLLNKYDVSSIRICHTGAAPVKKETIEAFEQQFNYPSIQNGYGLTETSAGVIWSVSDSSGRTIKPGSSGKVSPGVKLKVIEPATGKILDSGETGEVCIHSPLVMKGYLNRPDATKAVIDEEGWLHTGDIGYYDSDGYFFIVDRLKELIKYKGNQVAPAELEAVLLEHPDVTDVGVVGVADEVAGELPRAYIVKREGSGLTEDKIISFINDKVSHYKRLRGGVLFINEIPKLATGKILRRKLREMAHQKSKL